MTVYAVLALLVIFIVHEALEWFRERRYVRRARFLKRLVDRMDDGSLRSIGYKRAHGLIPASHISNEQNTPPCGAAHTEAAPSFEEVPRV